MGCFSTYPFGYWLLPCGCTPSVFHAAQCPATPASCPTTVKIPVRSACCEKAVLCRAESANGSLHTCAVRQQKAGWMNDAHSSKMQGAALALGADILAYLCDTELQTCVSDAMRRLIPTTPC